jgi:hypothetical protein
LNNTVENICPLVLNFEIWYAELDNHCGEWKTTDNAQMVRNEAPHGTSKANIKKINMQI